jgi:glycosyltransferase involved in cell wall biosynthesis
MILIDAIFINESGGKVLLDYLVENLENTKMEVHYLFDDRIQNNHPEILTNQVTYLKASLYRRFKFYKKNESRFSKILCFGNLPPNIKIKAEVFTYFHQSLFIEQQKSISHLNKFKLQLKSSILNLLKNNTDVWLVQSECIKKGLVKKYNLNPSTVKILPFYPSIRILKNIVRKKHSFTYVSNGAPHKNHDKLIKAFCIFYDNFSVGELRVTISDDFVVLIKKLDALQKRGYPIVNYGFIKRNNLAEVYASSEFIIFPSFVESFGLGIIEGLVNGCKVVGSELPYLYAVCNPSITFDPYSVEEIVKAFEKALLTDIKESKLKTDNEIENLINLLKIN